MQSFPAALEQLVEVTKRAGAIAQDVRRKLTVDQKPDGSLVTNADRATEEFLRQELPLIVRETTCWGEEYGREEPGPGGQWIIDPIDGTSNFAYGSPLWGVSVGLRVGDDLTMGCVYLADLDEVYFAKKGFGAFHNFERLLPIPAGPVNRNELITIAERIWARKSELPGKSRTTGSFVVEGCWVARQRFRGMIGAGESLYDAAACLVICQELGAEIRYADGQRFSFLDISEGQSISAPWIIFPADSGFLLP